MNRRGIAMSQLVLIILSIAGFALLIMIINFIVSGLGEEAGPQACRASVTARMGVKERVGTGWLDDTAARAIPLSCTTEEVTIPREVTRTMSDEEVRSKTMEDMADLMATCWWMFGTGDYHDVFAQKWGDENLCHICYSVEIEGARGLEEPIGMKEFKRYLDTHNYDPGLLRSGGAAAGELRMYKYEEQDVMESSLESRRLTTQRLLTSKTHLQTYLADFTGIFEGDQTSLNTIRNNLNTISHKHDIEFTLVLVPSLPEQVWREEKPVARNILNEWNIGDESMNNGYVLLFSLNDGKVQYANDVGSAAVLPGHIIDSILNEKLAPQMASGNPKQALLDFTQGVKESLQDTQNAQKKMLFQRTYTAYITGGRVGSQLLEHIITGEGHIKPKGAISFGMEHADTAKNFKLEPGNNYAITFTSPQWYTGQSVKEATKAPTIGVSYYQDFLNGDTPCNVYQED